MYQSLVGAKRGTKVERESEGSSQKSFEHQALLISFRGQVERLDRDSRGRNGREGTA